MNSPFVGIAGVIGIILTIIIGFFLIYAKESISVLIYIVIAILVFGIILGYFASRKR